MVIRLVLSARLLHKCFAFISWTPGLLYICIVSQLCKQAYSLLSDTSVHSALNNQTVMQPLLLPFP